MMKPSPVSEQNENSPLKMWDPIAAKTRKLIECSFGMLKSRFEALCLGARMTHEEEASRLCIACIHVKYLFGLEDDAKAYLPQD